MMNIATFTKKSAKHVLAISLFALVLLAILSSPAHAALGEFLYKWGNETYNIQSAWAVAVDSVGNMYVVDNSTAREVKAFNNKGVFITKWGSYGTGNGKFQSPMGIAVDSNGDVYVTDTDVQVFSGIVSGNTGSFLRRWGPPGYGDGQLIRPWGIAIDSSDHVYVADHTNPRVQVFSKTGEFLDIKMGESGTGELGGPWGIAVDSSGDMVYVADGNDVHIFEKNSNNSYDFLRQWPVQCSWAGVAVDSSGKVFVSNGNVVNGNNPGVQVFDSAGNSQPPYQWGSYGTRDGQFNIAAGIAVGPTGNVYVIDPGNHNVQLFSNTTGTFLRKWTAGIGDGLLYTPKSAATDTRGNVYVADRAHQRVQVFDNTGAYLRKWGSQGTGDGQFSSPTGLAVDLIGNIYVADSSNNNVQVISSSTGTFSIKLDGQFNSPSAVAVDLNDNVYVADTGNNRIQVFSASTGSFLRQWGSSGSGLGQFSIPSGIAVDSNGTIYVIENGNSRLQVFSSSTGTFTCGTYGTGAEQFKHPNGVTVDGSGNVYVVDSGNYRIQVLSVSGTTCNFFGRWGEQGTGDGQFTIPYGVASDPTTGNVFVTDSTNNTVQAFEGACMLFANAGPDQIVEQTSPEGAFVTLDGSGSRQVGPCSEELTYTWTWQGGSTNGITPTVLMSAGTTTVNLTVTNGTQTSSPDSVIILVQATMWPVITMTFTPGIVPTKSYTVTYGPSGKDWDYDSLLGGNGVWTYTVIAKDGAGKISTLTNVINAGYSW